MSDEPSIRITVDDPDEDDETCTFTLDRALTPGEAVYFISAQDAVGKPLMSRLLGIDHVYMLVAKGPTLTVYKTEEGEWYQIVSEIIASCQVHFEAHPEDGRIREMTDSEASLRERIQAVLDQDINPMVAMHGGVIRLLDVRGTTAYIQMGGGCQGCGMASVTLKQGVRAALEAKVPEITEVLDNTDHASGTNPFYAPSRK